MPLFHDTCLLVMFSSFQAAFSWNSVHSPLSPALLLRPLFNGLRRRHLHLHFILWTPAFFAKRSSPIPCPHIQQCLICSSPALTYSSSLSFTSVSSTTSAILIHNCSVPVASTNLLSPLVFSRHGRTLWNTSVRSYHAQTKHCFFAVCNVKYILSKKWIAK